MNPMHWTEVPITYLDFEGSRRSGILEYGLVVLRQGKIDRCETRLCQPTGEVGPEDVRLHGIREEEARAHPAFAEDWDRFTAARREGVMGSHFAGVENHLLKSVWPCPPPSPDFLKGKGKCNDWGPWIDTGRLYRNLYPGIPSVALTGLVRLFQLETELAELAELHCPPGRRRYHAALYDALAGALLLLRIGRLPEFADMGLGWLIRMSRGKEQAAGLAQTEFW